MSDDLVTPSSRRTSAAKQAATLDRVRAKAAEYGLDIDQLPSQQQQPSGPAPNLTSTPLAGAMSDLADAKRSVQAAGGDEATIIRAVAQRIRQKVGTMPAGMMQPMSDAEIDGLVDSTIQQILAEQRKRISTNAASALKMSATRLVVKQLTADNQRRVESVQRARRLQSRGIGIAAVRLDNVPMGRVPNLLELRPRAGISFFS